MQYAGEGQLYAICWRSAVISNMIEMHSYMQYVGGAQLYTICWRRAVKVLRIRQFFGASRNSLVDSPVFGRKSPSPFLRIHSIIFLLLEVRLRQSWKKLHAAHALRADIFDRIEDILVQRSHTYVAIADLWGDFNLFEVNIEE